MNDSSCAKAFIAFCEARQHGVLIKRVSQSDKEFHFQNWVSQRLAGARLEHDVTGRNAYPDFTLVHYPEGYEVKGLQYPGREATYDSNSRVPTGRHNGRTIWYVFGRYPSAPEEAYPLIDLVVCHGDFLNADHNYLHQNKSVRGFGSYGDLVVRDRKMYVAPTPFALTIGAAAHTTLIAPENQRVDHRLEPVGELVRTEADTVLVSYSFNLLTNELTQEFTPNAHSGQQHRFLAYRRPDEGASSVRMNDLKKITKEMAGGEDDTTRST